MTDEQRKLVEEIRARAATMGTHEPKVLPKVVAEFDDDPLWHILTEEHGAPLLEWVPPFCVDFFCHAHADVCALLELVDAMAGETPDGFLKVSREAHRLNVEAALERDELVGVLAEAFRILGAVFPDTIDQDTIRFLFDEKRKAIALMQRYAAVRERFVGVDREKGDGA